MNQDRETGEICREPETGELVYFPSVNTETGETELYNSGYDSQINNLDINDQSNTKPFRIPKDYIQKNQKEKRQLEEKPFKSSESRVEFITAIMFLVPSVIVFNMYLATAIMCLELLLHIWCHKKNRDLSDETRYYRSPLHVMSKEYCARCKAETAIEKIHKIQEIRHERFKKYSMDSIRRVVT